MPITFKDVEPVEVLTNVGDPGLAHDRNFASRWVRNSLPMRKRLAQLEQDIIDELTQRVRRPTVQGLHNLCDEAMDEIEGMLERARRGIADRTVKVYKDLWRDVGERAPKASRKGISAAAAKLSQADEFDMWNIDDVMRTQRRNLKRKVTKAFQAETFEETLRRLQYGITGGPAKRSPYLGGTTAKSLRTIFISEQSRAARYAEIMFMERHGIELAYWRLSDSHPNYGGTEVCEHLAAAVSDEVVARAEELGIAHLDLRGMYLLKDIPETPHPNCLCYREPVFLDR